MMQIDARELVEAGFYKDESEVIRDGIKHLLLHHPEYKVKVAIERYKKEKISLGKAADIAGLSIEEMKELLKEQGIPLVWGEDVKEIIEDAENARKSMR